MTPEGTDDVRAVSVSLLDADSKLVESRDAMADWSERKVNVQCKSGVK